MFSFFRIFSIQFVFAFVLLAGCLNSFAQPAITGIYVPVYVQGTGDGNPSSERRVPYGHYVEVTGLNANATYRYCNRFTDAPAVGNNGFGNWIIANKTGNFSRGTGVNLNTPGNYGEFTTDNTGKARLWLIGEPSIDTRFNPGSVPLYARLLLNNGAGGTSVTTRLTVSDAPISTINFGSANNATSGTGVRSTAAPGYKAKDFVMLYDNLNATGRPIAGTYVESDGVRQLAYNDPDITNEGYAPFYAQEVDGKDKTWGAIIPNALANGIRNISSYSLQDGSLVFETKSADATFPTIPSGTISTVNPTSGLAALVISGPGLTLPVKLSSFAAVCGAGQKGVQLEWKAELESDLAAYEIQHAVDGVNFIKLASQQPKGALATYKFSVPDDFSSSFFRLKMIDKDGKYEFSKVVKTNCGRSSRFSVYPNPATNTLSVNHTVARQGSSVSILSMNGSHVQGKNMLNGSTNTVINIGSLTPGNYILVVKNGQEVEGQTQFTKL